MQEDRATVLVVDDTAENIDVLRGVLRRLYKVKVATNGERALEMAHGSVPPDLILLDIMMPGMDGYEVCRRLKDDPHTARIPIVFVTAMNSSDDEAKGFELGAVDYISKPIKPAVVRARVATQLTLHHQSRILRKVLSQCTAELDAMRQFLQTGSNPNG